ncbi:MAG: tetratricopeptide repeat protein [Bdellovibrionota bacterium]|jgi:tetratricopeptide (TPR) repeat protein
MKRLLIFLMCIFSACSVVQPESNPANIMQARDLIDAGVIKMRLGQLTEAQAIFELALELAPLAETFDGLGCLAFLRGDFKEAQRLFLTAYDRDEEYAPALEHLALLYEVYGFLEEADALYLKALSIDPTLLGGRNNRAAFLFDNHLGSDSEIKNEFLKAKTVADHPVIKANLKALDGNIK